MYITSKYNFYNTIQHLLSHFFVSSNSFNFKILMSQLIWSNSETLTALTKHYCSEILILNTFYFLSYFYCNECMLQKVEREIIVYCVVSKKWMQTDKRTLNIVSNQDRVKALVDPRDFLNICGAKKNFMGQLSSICVS